MRYSKGIFDGPTIRIKYSKKKLTIGSSFEYEDVLTYIIAKSLPKNFTAQFEVTGKIISGSDFTQTLKTLGILIEAQQKKDKETKKVQNYMCSISSKDQVWITKDTLIQLMEQLHSTCYLLLNFTVYVCSECSSNMAFNPKAKIYTCEACGAQQKRPSVEYSIKTAGNPPRPKIKSKGAPKSESQEITNKIKFCKAILPNDADVRTEILNEIVPDFKDEISSNVKELELENNYHIENLILPPRELMKNSRLFRKMTIRAGFLERILRADSNSFENAIQFKI